MPQSDAKTALRRRQKNNETTDVRILPALDPGTSMAPIKPTDSGCSEKLEHLPKNLVDAYVWYVLAALRGLDGAMAKARALTQHLSSDQLKMAVEKLSTLVAEGGGRVDPE